MFKNVQICSESSCQVNAFRTAGPLIQSFNLILWGCNAHRCFSRRWCWYRFNGKLLTLRRLQAKSKVQTDVVDKLLYVDDLTEKAKSEEKMHGPVDRMSKACNNFQLTISTKKTEVVHHPAPGKPYSEPAITVKGQKLHAVDKFTYLWSTPSRAVHIDDEVTARTAKTSVAFGRLRTNVFEWTGIRLDTKLKV